MLRVLGVHTDGGMREQITVPIDKLHRSESVPLEHLALVETLCIGAHAVDRAGLEPEQSDTGDRRRPDWFDGGGLCASGRRGGRGDGN